MLNFNLAKGAGPDTAAGTGPGPHRRPGEGEPVENTDESEKESGGE